MKKIKKTSLFYALLLLSTAFNTHKTHAMEPEDVKKVGWVALAGGVILGGYAAYQQFLSYIHAKPFDFTQLPKDVQNVITTLLYTGATATSLEEAGKTINALAQVNKELNTLINDPKFCLTTIKTLALKFNCTDQEAAEALQTQEAKKRLDIQKKFFDICNQENSNEQAFNDLYNKYKDYVDLNFIYKEKKNLLHIAAMKDNCPLIRTLLDHGLDINKAAKNGMTALMSAVFVKSRNAVQCLLDNPNIKINQQDEQGRTALFFTRDALIVKLLLDAGADPEIADKNGLTALAQAQEVGNQEIIDLIQEAIEKKHEQQGK